MDVRLRLRIVQRLAEEAHALVDPFEKNVRKCVRIAIGWLEQGDHADLAGFNIN